MRGKERESKGQVEEEQSPILPSFPPPADRRGRADNTFLVAMPGPGKTGI